MKNDTKIFHSTPGHLNPLQLREFLLLHLNRIYCAKANLQGQLPKLAAEAEFKDLKYAIAEISEDIGKQIARLDEIYVLLDDKPSLTNCCEVVEVIKKGYNPVHPQITEQPGDLSILFYLSIIESIELASYQLLQMATVHFLDKQIKQLLRENFDESIADRILLLQITAVYIA